MSANPTTRIESRRAETNGNNSALMFPAEIDSLPFYMQISFEKYNRSGPADRATTSNSGTVILPIPNSLPEGYNVDYTEVEHGLWKKLQDAIATGKSIADANGTIQSGHDAVAAMRRYWGDFDISETGSNIKNTVMGMNMSEFMTFAAGITTPSWRDSKSFRTAYNAFGIIPNPHLTTFFNGVALRKVSYSWLLSPRSMEESLTLRKIESFIKQRMHPTESENRLTLGYPDEVSFKFIGSDGFLQPFSRSVITSMTMDKAPQGSAFYDSGAPVQVALSMSFQEVEIQTRESLGGEREISDSQQQSMQMNMDVG